MPDTDPALLKFKLGKSGFSLAEIMVGVAVLGIVVLAMPTTFQSTMTMGTTSDRIVEESLLYKNAGNILAAATSCTAALQGYSAAPGTQLTLTAGCAPQPGAPFDDTATYSATNIGLCAGGVYDNKINIGSVALQNENLIAPNTYSADVAITGYKIGQIYGSDAVVQTLKVLFTTSGGNIVSCLGSDVATPQADCVAVGCQWINGACNCCTQIGGVWNGTYCLLPDSQCYFPAGTGWIDPNNFSECKSAAAVTMNNGDAPIALIDSSAPYAGSEQVSCVNGVPKATSPICKINECHLVAGSVAWWDPTNTYLCMLTNDLWIPVSQSAVGSAGGAPGANVGSASFWCPIYGGTPIIVNPTNCGPSAVTACVFPAATSFGSDSSGNPCIADSAVNVPAGGTGTVTDLTGPTIGSGTFVCPAAGGPSGTISNFTCSTTCTVAASTSWGGSCTIAPEFVGTVIPNGKTLAVTGGSTAGYTGSENLTCNNGVIATSAAACALGTMQWYYTAAGMYPAYTTFPNAAAASAAGYTDGPFATLAAATASFCGADCSSMCTAGNSYGCGATCIPNCEASDIRLKEDITYIGHENGEKIYSFRYKHGFGPDNDDRQYYIGVMAQDLLRTRPEAVVTMPNGFYAVRYDVIGVKFRKFAGKFDGGGLCR